MILISLSIVSCSPKYKVGDCGRINTIQGFAFQIKEVGEYAYLLDIWDGIGNKVSKDSLTFDTLDKNYVKIDCKFLNIQ